MEHRHCSNYGLSGYSRLMERDEDGVISATKGAPA